LSSSTAVSFVALHDDPGIPGEDGWQILSRRSYRGPVGEAGPRGRKRRARRAWRRCPNDRELDNRPCPLPCCSNAIERESWTANRAAGVAPTIFRRRCHPPRRRSNQGCGATLANRDRPCRSTSFPAGLRASGDQPSNLLPFRRWLLGRKCEAPNERIEAGLRSNPYWADALTRRAGETQALGQIPTLRNGTHGRDARP
jgi:hypothetical protein